MAKANQKKSDKSPKGPKEKSFFQKVTEAIKRQKTVLLFWGGVLAILAAFFWLSAWPFYMDNIFKPAVTFYAKAGSLILNLMGQGTQAVGETVSSSAFSMNIAKGCDGIAPIILLLAGILVYPSKWKFKWKGMLYGTLILIVLNLVRLVSLFLFGAHAPSLFDLMHVEVWQAVFIIIAVLIWVWWLIWVKNQENIPLPSSPEIEKP